MCCTVQSAEPELQSPGGGFFYGPFVHAAQDVDSSFAFDSQNALVGFDPQFPFAMTLGLDVLLQPGASLLNVQMTQIVQLDQVAVAEPASLGLLALGLAGLAAIRRKRS